MSDVQGIKVDPDEIAVAQVAVRATVNTFTYDGFNVGSRVTDDQCKELAVAVVAAIESFRGGKTI